MFIYLFKIRHVSADCYCEDYEKKYGKQLRILRCREFSAAVPMKRRKLLLSVLKTRKHLHLSSENYCLV